MQDDDEASDAVDVQPYQEISHRVTKASPMFPWGILVAGVVLSAVIMAVVTVSTVPLSFVTAQSRKR